MQREVLAALAARRQWGLMADMCKDLSVRLAAGSGDKRCGISGWDERWGEEMPLSELILRLVDLLLGWFVMNLYRQIKKNIRK